jgi:hypothetical protein
MLTLKHPYISVTDGSHQSYGGDQGKSENATMRKCGCGVIAAADVLLYLNCRYDCFRDIRLNPSGTIAQKEYEKLTALLRRRYFPLIPHAGMNGVALMTGMNLYFMRNQLPLSAEWRFFNLDIWERIAKMLAEDIPVIMAVGPNFPFFWQNNRTMLYTKDSAGSYHASSSAKAHYVTVTGLDESWVQISSWGRLLYINRIEFDEYTKKHSAGFLCSILYIKHK